MLNADNAAPAAAVVFRNSRRLRFGEFFMAGVSPKCAAVSSAFERVQEFQQGVPRRID